jgi:replicative DNA helicase
VNALAGLVDKNAIMQVFGSLIQNPLLFSEIGSRGLVVADFDTRFTRSIFMAILNLVLGGTNTITIVDVDNYLQAQPTLYTEFTKNNGIGFLQDCYDLANVENFQYYYKRVKKFTALRQLKAAGINISDIYPENEDDVVKEKKLLDKFDDMDVADIFNHVQTKIQNLQYDFTIINANSKDAAGGLRKLVEELKEIPEIGYPLQGTIFNNISRGARRGKFYLNSGSSGSGKSRSMIGDACFLAYPQRWNSQKNIWEKTPGGKEKVLILTTELTDKEVQTIILANITDINEQKKKKE